MSTATTAKHSQAIEKIDLTIRKALSTGDIVKMMKDLNSKIVGFSFKIGTN